MINPIPAWPMPLSDSFHDIPMRRHFGAGARTLATGLGAMILVLAIAASLVAASSAGTLRALDTYTLPACGTMAPPFPLFAREFALIKEGDYFHIFWMKRDWSAPADSTDRELGHATSRDLFHWTQLPTVLQCRPDKWDNFHIWAPTLIKSGGTFYMYYTGVTRVPYGWNLFQRIGLATSTDLLNWTRTDQPVLSGAVTPWAFSDSSVFAGCQFRDPFAMPDPTTPGRTLLYYVAVPAAATSQLIVGVAQTGDFLNFSDIGPLWCTDAAHYWGWCESPHIIQHNGLYYLFTTTTSGHCISFRTASSPLADSLGWSDKHNLYDMAGQDPTSDRWFGSEAISTPGHDYLAVIHTPYYQIDFYEIIWDATPPGFTLATPVITAAVPADPAHADLSLSTIPRAGSGPGVMFRASLPAPSHARVDLFDVGGRRVRTLQDGPLPEGESVVSWDGRLDGGAGAPAGVYFAALTVPAGRRVARVSVTN